MFVVMSMIAGRSIAQLQKGNYLLGGSLIVGSSKQENSTASNLDSYRYNSFAVYPDIGQMVSPTLAVGISGGFSHSKNTYKSTSTVFNSSSTNINRSKGYSIGGFVRKYLEITPKLYFMMQGNARFNHNNQANEQKFFDGALGTTNTIKSESKANGGSVGINPGFTWLVNERIGIEAFLGGVSYLYSRNKDSDINNSGFNFDLDLQSFGLGLRFYLGSPTTDQ